MPRGGTPQALQSGVDAPAIDAKLPSTSRVLPKPTTGEPSSVLVTVRESSSPRRSLLCWLASRSWKTVPSGLSKKAIVATSSTPAVSDDRGRAALADLQEHHEPTTPSAREAQRPRLRE